MPVAFHYGWIVLAVAFLTSLTGAGIRSAAQVFIVSLESEFGWSRSEIASAVAVSLFLFGVAGPISGWLLDRFGPRRVMMCALAVLCAGLTGTTVMQQLWQFALLWGIFVGFGAGGIATVLAASLVHRWFVARRGIALGLLNSASSTGQLIFIPLLMAVVVTAGWRAGSLLLAGTSIGLIALIAFLMRDDPSEVGLEPYGSDFEASSDLMAPLRGAPGTPSSVRVTDAFKSRTFWLLCGIFFVCGGTANGLIGTHLIPHAVDRGISQVTAAATVGVMGGMNFVGTLTSGWLTDRVDNRKLLAAVFALRGAALFLLPFANDFSGLFVFAVIYGLDWYATVSPVIALTGDTFGKQAIGRIFGWIFLSHQIGAAFSATGAAALFQYFGDYQSAFFTGGIMGMMAALMALSIKPQQPSIPIEPEPTGLARA